MGSHRAFVGRCFGDELIPENEMACQQSDFMANARLDEWSLRLFSKAIGLTNIRDPSGAGKCTKCPEPHADPPWEVPGPCGCEDPLHPNPKGGPPHLWQAETYTPT